MGGRFFGEVSKCWPRAVLLPALSIFYALLGQYRVPPRLRRSPAKAPQRGWDNFDGLSLNREEPRFRSEAYIAEIAFSKFLSGRAGINQPTPDNDKFRIEGYGEIGHMQTEGLGLIIENFERQGIAFLGTAAKGKGLLLGRGPPNGQDRAPDTWEPRNREYCGKPDRVV